MTKQIKGFIKKLKKLKVNAIITNELSERIIHATDNSIYECLPELVIYPKDEKAVSEILKVSCEPRFSKIHFTAKGGATGCNGQSLNNSVVIDFSRFMTKIKKFNKSSNTIIVEPGVTLDEINQHLKKHNLCFPINISPSNRATIGGMFNTDASGKGSLRFGKTSQHILNTRVVLANGKIMSCFQKKIKDNKVLNQIENKIIDISINNQEKINKIFKNEIRFLTGYNLKHMYDPKNKFLSLHYLFSGSEGTLGIVTELTLKLSQIIKSKKLLVVSYKTFEDCLVKIKEIRKYKPISIEVIDETMMSYTENQIEIGHAETKSMSFIEIDDSSDQKSILKLIQQHALNVSIIHETKKINKYWKFRADILKHATIGKNNKLAIPFMEDHAVDTENLVSYIKEIKALLQKYKVEAAMYGHADVGCIHMRPKLDLSNKNDYKTFILLQKESIKLVKKYQGRIWSEHGKGFRTEALQDQFKNCYPLLKEIKYLLDPTNKLNPGKIVNPLEPLKLYNSLGPLRSNKPHIEKHEKALFQCNGNGLCHSSSNEDIMCPSYKYSRHKIHSPKGRAMLLKFWQQNINKRTNKKLINELTISLDNCLNCKACSTKCPVKIDIPRYKYHFLNQLYIKKWRPLAHHLMFFLEENLTFQIKYLKLISFILNQKITKFIIAKIFKLQNLPTPSKKQIYETNYNKNGKTIYLLQDPFTMLYQNDLINKAINICIKLNLNLKIIPYINVGKSYHILGNKKKFERQAKKASHILNAQYQNKEILVLDPSIYDCLKYDYQESGFHINVKLLSIQALLSKYFTKKISMKEKNSKYLFFMHCLEQYQDKNDLIWSQLFKKLNLNIKIKKIGCCGQAGMYGYYKNNESASQEIFENGWHKQISKNTIPVVSGFSCFHKLKINNHKPMHIIQFIHQSFCEE